MANKSEQLLHHLPAIYHSWEAVRELLSIFEAVLLDSRTADSKATEAPVQGKGKALAEQITAIARLFDPEETPEEFVPWLSKWVALTHAGGLPLEHQRKLIKTIVPLYAYRGTKHYLKEILKFFAPENSAVIIEDQLRQGFVVGSVKLGTSSKLGSNDRPFWFNVTINAPAIAAGGQEQEFKSRWEKSIRCAIDLAKPAHTLYELNWRFDAASAN